MVSVYCAPDDGWTLLSLAVLGDRYCPGGCLSSRPRLSRRCGRVLYPRAVPLFVVWRASVLLSCRRLLLLLSLSDVTAVDLAESGCLQEEMRVVYWDVARFGCLAGAHRVE